MGHSQPVASGLRPKKGKTMQYRIIVVVAFMLLTLGVFSGTALADDPIDPGNAPVGPVGNVDVLDPSYDDGWVADFPDTIAGHSVEYFTTPKDRACNDEPMIYLKSTAASLDKFLANVPDVGAIGTAIEGLADAPSGYVLSFSPVTMDVVAARSEDAAWNAARLENGCPSAWQEVGNAGRGRGYAIFQNLDAGRYTDDNAQSVRIRSPRTIGDNQDDGFSAALNNVVTEIKNNKPFALQGGMQFDPDDNHGGTMIGWTDSSRKLIPRKFRNVPYRADAYFYLTNSYTNGQWWICAGDQEHIDTRYQCVARSSAPGDNLIENANTSVFFENANANSNWHSGFPSQMVLYDATIYRNGLPNDWTRENQISAHACGSGYPVSGAMSGSLKNGGTAYWLLSGIARAC